MTMSRTTARHYVGDDDDVSFKRSTAVRQRRRNFGAGRQALQRSAGSDDKLAPTSQASSAAGAAAGDGG